MVGGSAFTRMSLARIAIASSFASASVPKKQCSMYSRKQGRKCWRRQEKKSQGLVSLFNHEQIHKKTCTTPGTEESKYSQMSQQSIRFISPGTPSHQHRDTLLPQQGQWFDVKIQFASNLVSSGHSRSLTLPSPPTLINLIPPGSPVLGLRYQTSFILHFHFPSPELPSLYPIRNKPISIIPNRQASFCEHRYLSPSPTLSTITKLQHNGTDNLFHS